MLLKEQPSSNDRRIERLRQFWSVVDTNIGGKLIIEAAIRTWFVEQVSSLLEDYKGISINIRDRSCQPRACLIWFDDESTPFPNPSLACIKFWIPRYF